MNLGSGRLKRSFWSVFDQGVSSLSNMIFGVTAARHLDAADFGAIGLILALYSIALNIIRGMTSTTMIITTAGSGPDEIKAYAARSLTISVGASVGLAGIMSIASLFMESGFADSMLVLALGLPVLLGQDHLRYVFVTLRRSDLATLTDLVWLAAILPGLFIPLPLSIGPSEMTAGWIAGAGVSLIAGLLLAHLTPRCLGVTSQLRAQGSLMWRYSLEATIVGFSRQAAILATGIVVGVAAASGIRAAAILFGPYSVVSSGLIFMATVEAARLLKVGNRAMCRFLVVLSVGLAALALAVAFALSFLPDPLGEALMGDSWREAQPVVILTGLIVAMSGLQTGAYIGLSALKAASNSLTLRGSFLVLTVLVTVLGAYLGGAPVAMAFAAVSEFLSGLFAWRILLNHLFMRTTRVDVTDRGMQHANRSSHADV